MLTENEIYNFSIYHNAKSLLMDFADLKRIAEGDIRDILKFKERDISITPMLVSFSSCGTDVEVDKVTLINGNVYLSGKFPSGKEANKPFSEIWDIHHFADICKEIGV
jgi:hypothetical protein